MGFCGFSQLHNHFKEFFYKKQPAHVDDATQAQMQHGIQHEISDYFL